MCRVPALPDHAARADAQQLRAALLVLGQLRQRELLAAAAAARLQPGRAGGLEVQFEDRHAHAGAAVAAGSDAVVGGARRADVLRLHVF